MSAPYEVRTNDNGRSKKQSMAELKLRRLNELNQRLQEDLNRRRIPVSEAAVELVAPRILCSLRVAKTITDHTPRSLIAFTDKEPKDFMVPSRWGAVSRAHQGRLQIEQSLTQHSHQVDKREDPYAPQQSGGCCTVM